MRKYIPLVIALFFLEVRPSKAQFVTIPDANFAAWLNTNVPSAMSGNQMDTTNVAVTNLRVINVENLGIKDLTGIQYFKSLTTLDCGNGSPSADSNHLTSLPNLPGTLDSLICGNNQITSLPTLPLGLSYLACYINKLSLPTLPGGLIHLDCHGNYYFLTSLPTLPTTLSYLDCSYNQLSSLPALPANLTTLFCDYNYNLTSLPTLPAGLQILTCASNNMTSLPTLPAALKGLSCIGNKLTNLPSLPAGDTALYCTLNLLTSLPSPLPAGLTQLVCDQNQLDSLPALPGTLVFLWCQLNQLTSLPTLPGKIIELECDDNQLTSLPAFPSSLTYFTCSNNYISCFPIFPSGMDGNFLNISGNPFTCLPNYITGMNAATLAFPLCEAGNTNGCPNSPGITGFTYEDMNSDCIQDIGDSNLVNIPVKLYDGSNNLLSQTYSAINGVYDFPDTANTYRVHIDTTGMPFVSQCLHPGIDSTVTITSLDTNINFSLTCKPGFDVGVQSATTIGLIFPGMQHNLSVVAGDMSQWYNLNCAKGDSGTVQITVTGPVTYIGPGTGALTPLVSGNIFTYHIADYSAIHNTSAFNLLLKTDTSAHAGDIICVSVTVTPFADNNSANNTYAYCYNVINSHDPNYKEVYPVDVLPGYTGWFTYTVHFQNTGTASANNIMLADTLDKNLDVSTFQLINYSYQNTVSLTGNVLLARFNGINLPDSTVNPTGSTGFIQYRIKPKPGLTNGTVIGNTCYIYFDYNAPVVTNTTQNLFTTVASVNTITTKTYCKAYPNPTSGAFTVALQNVKTKCSVIIYNSLGQEVFTAPLNMDNTAVNLTGKSTGIYFYRVLSQDGNLIGEGKLVVE